MSAEKAVDVRKVLLESIEAMSGWGVSKVLEEAGNRLNADRDKALQQAILVQWQSLFTNGLLAWGVDLRNCDPPWFHVTDRGRETLKHISRDPANPEGYMNYLASSHLDAIAESYLREALQTYNSGCYKATAVMVGGAAERLVLELNEAVQNRLSALGRPTNPKLDDWRIKAVSDELTTVLTDALSRAIKLARTDEAVKLRESFVYHWPSLVHEIRASRNDAGHPGSIDPVTPEDVHAALLTFPHVARIINQIKGWVATAAL
jgi:hypothetical protein